MVDLNDDIVLNQGVRASWVLRIQVLDFPENWDLRIPQVETVPVHNSDLFVEGTSMGKGKVQRTVDTVGGAVVVGCGQQVHC